ncbi:hypothetical protein LSTR_LSTR015011 [Laodelphax striatellus]|uniref:Uncharacterized protein n=1 Tax=Laodelphax striatellus TaxID=195883 RepID=A0A482WLT3_LAOST|nr:hypothetical protein LSTR_LSTR015011 [Laodelphax striatellus]
MRNFANFSERLIGYNGSTVDKSILATLALPSGERAQRGLSIPEPICRTLCSARRTGYAKSALPKLSSSTLTKTIRLS